MLIVQVIQSESKCLGNMRERLAAIALALLLAIEACRGLEREDDPSVSPFANEIRDSHGRARLRQNLDEGPSRPGTSAANDFVDGLLESLPKFEAHINPARLGDLNKGSLQLTNVTLAGITDAYRHGNARLNITQDYLHIATRLGSPKLIFRGRYRYKLPWLLPRISGSVRIGLNRIVILVDMRMAPSGPELVDLHVTSLHSITVDDLTGLAPLNWALRYLVEVGIRRNQANILKMLEQESRAYIKGALDRTQNAAMAINEIEQEIIQDRRERDLIDSNEPN